MKSYDGDWVVDVGCGCKNMGKHCSEEKQKG